MKRTALFIASTGSTPNEFLFARYQIDAATTGLIYLATRYYNAATGVFSSRDANDGSTSNPISLNHYLYADADPVDNVDPSGHGISADVTVSANLSFSIDAFASIPSLAVLATSATLACSLIHVGSLLDGMLGTNFADNAACGDAQMRIQLQEGFVHTFSIPIHAPAPVGVSTFQVRTTMQTLYSTYKVAAPWYPTNLEPNLVSAIIDISKYISNFPPLGTRTNATIRTVQWTDRRRNFRLDLENLRGWNLRI